MRPLIKWGKEETVMKCKYCQAELNPNSSVCPECGKDNLKDNLKGLKITALVLVCTVMLVLLAGLVCYGVTGSFIPNWFGSDSAGDNDGSGSDSTAGTETVTDVSIITADGQLTVTSDELESYMSRVVATMGDYELTNSELQLYYWLVAYNEEDLDPTASLTEQIYDDQTGETWHDHCVEMAIDAWKEVMVMSDAAAKADFEMPAEHQEYLDSMQEELEYYVQMYVYYYGYDMETVDDLIQSMYGPGCTYEDYYNYCYNYYYGGLYWSEVADAIEVSDAEIDSYFEANKEALANDYDLSITKDFGNLMDVRNILIEVVTGADDEGVVTEDWNATLKAAQEVYDLWLAGDKTEESFIALVEEYSEDTSTNTNGGLITDLYKNSMAFVDVRHILVMPEGGTTAEDGTTTYSDDEWAAAYTEAEAILNEWLAGDKTEDSFAALANEYSDDNNGNVTNGGIYTDVYLGQMVKNFENWCFDSSRQTGDYDIVQTPFGYHIMYFVRADREADNWISDETRVPGDAAMLKTDEGYQILYFVGAEPAWIRYSRYGVQTEQAQAQLDKLLETVTVTVDDSQIAVCKMAGSDQ